MTDAELLAEIEAVEAKPTKGEAVGRGVVQGLSLGWGDEMAALLSALPGGAPDPDGPIIDRPKGATFLERFRNARDPDRAKNAAAQKAHPGAYLLAQIASSAPAMALTGGGLASVAGQGATQGAGYSEHEGSRLLGDSALGAAGGLAGYGAGKLLGKAAQGVVRVASKKTGAAARRAQDLATKAKTADVAQATSKYGGLRQTENKAIREAAAMEAAGTISDENAALLAKARESGRFNEALNEALKNDLEFLTTRTPEVAAAKEAMIAAREGLPDAIAAEKARILSGAMAKEQIKARLKRYGPMGAAGALLGSTALGVPGALGGAAAGAAVRPMLHAVRRAATHPAVQTAIWNPVERAATKATTPGAALLHQVGARAAAVPAAAGSAERLGDYLRKSKSEREAEAELERLLAE